MLYCFTVRLPASESRDVEEGREVKGQAETHNMMTHTVHNVNRRRKRCTLFLKNSSRLSLSSLHVNATFHDVICSHCEISHLPLGMVDDITHQIQFAVKIYTVQSRSMIPWWVKSDKKIPQHTQVSQLDQILGWYWRLIWSPVPGTAWVPPPARHYTVLWHVLTFCSSSQPGMDALLGMYPS